MASRTTDDLHTASDHPSPIPAWADGAAQTERATLAAILLLGLGTILVYPVAAAQGPAIPGLTAFFAGILFMGHGCVAWLTVTLARAQRSPAILLLAMGFLASALLAAPYMAVFPRALVPGGPLFGSDTSATWLFTGLNLATSLPAIGAAALALAQRPAPVSRAAFDRLATLAILLTACLCAAVTALALTSDRWLPPLVIGNRFTPFYTALNVGILSLHALAAALMLALRGRIPVFAWAAVAHVAACLAHVAAGAGGMRYTVGWTYGRISYTLAALVVLIYFLIVFARQQKALATANNQLEQRVAQRTAELAAMVNERDVLLREVYHRVRNNLSIVDSLAHFQLRAVASPDGRAALADMRQRIQALAVLHEQLVEPMGPDHAPTLDLGRYLETLCRSLALSTGAESRGIQLQADIEARPVSPDVAAPLGMIVSELVTNAMRHAFADGGGTIRVSAHRAENGSFRLAIEDSGTSGNAARLLESTGLGGQIVKALARQLGATLSVDPGTQGRICLALKLD